MKIHKTTITYTLLNLFLITLTLWLIAACTNRPTQSLSGLPSNTACLNATDNGYTFDLLGHADNGDGTTTLWYRVTNAGKHSISHVAFGIPDGWEAIGPTKDDNYTGALGDYNVVWTNENGNPGFPSIKFETGFEGFGEGALDVFAVVVSGFDESATVQVAGKAGQVRGLVGLALGDANCVIASSNGTPTPTPPNSPLATPTPTETVIASNNDDDPLTQFGYLSSIVISDDLFENPLSEDEKQVRWNAGLPVPEIITLPVEQFANAETRLIRQYSKPAGLMAPVPQNIPADGWSTLYEEDFEDANFFPGCENRSFHSAGDFIGDERDDYRWGPITTITNTGDFSAWPSSLTNPGSGTANGYPTNYNARITCEFSDLGDVENFMVELAAWHREHPDTPSERLFVGFHTGEFIGTESKVYKGVSWSQTPQDKDGRTQWQKRRIFLTDFPETVEVLFMFIGDKYDGDEHIDAQGAFIDDVRIEQYKKHVTYHEDCNDPSVALSNASNGTIMNKGMNLDPYNNDFYDVRGPVADPELTEEMVARLKAIDTHWVRLEFKVHASAFAAFAPSTDVLDNPDTSPDLKHFDILVDTLCKNGIAVLGLIAYDTLVDNSWEPQGQVSNEYAEAFTQRAALLARYFKERIRYWEIWNEPNLETRRDEAGNYQPQLEPDQYSSLLQDTSDAIKGVDPELQIVSAGLYAADSAAQAYLIEVYDAELAPHHYDILGIHPYTSKNYLDPTDPTGQRYEHNPELYMRNGEPDKEEGATILHKFMNALTNQGDPYKPIWVTEIGWNRGKGTDLNNACTELDIRGNFVTEAEQVQYFYDGFKILVEETVWDTGTQAIPKSFWYKYRDTGQDTECGLPQVTSAWYRSYMYAAISSESNNKQLVDWWYGVYDGNRINPPPQLNRVGCAFARYPASPFEPYTSSTGELEEPCINQQSVFLPIIVDGTYSVTSSNNQ